MARPVLLALGIVTVAAAASLGQSSGHFRLVRSASGSKGAPDGGRYVFEDPRTTFQAGADRKIMVSFEWEGPAGRHHCVGSWKDPSGRTVFTSEADVVARSPRFGVYWGLSLADTVATGTWVLEASIDGEPAGAHSFQVQSGATEASAPARRPLSVAELYEKGAAQTLTVNAIDAGGAVIGSMSGFFVATDVVESSFAGINAAKAVQVAVPGRGRMETSEVVAWNRRDDWVLLRVHGSGMASTERSPESLRVGDRCFFLDAQEGGVRVIVETSVIGLTDAKLTLGNAASDASLGAPVFNEFGEVAASLVGSGLPGVSASDLAALGAPGGRVSRGARARALAAVPDAGATSRTFAELEQAGLFVKPLVRIPHHVTGVLTMGVDKQGRVPPGNERVRFTRVEGECVTVVTWFPTEK